MYSNILVPVVFDENRNPAASFQAARALANEGAKVTILNVMEAIPEYAASQIPPDVLARSREEIDTHLKTLSQKFPGATTALVSGHAGRTIVDYATDHDIDCIIVASHKPGFQNIFLGSTADRIVRHAHCAVHVIR